MFKKLFDYYDKTNYYIFENYCPSPMPRKGFNSSTYRFNYQGQESAESIDWTNFELRMYIASLGRFNAPDPYGQYHSPYTGMGNNPVNGVDPDGGYFIQFASEGGIAWGSRWIEQGFDDLHAWWRSSVRFDEGDIGMGTGNIGSVADDWNGFNSSDWAGGLLNGYMAGQALGLADPTGFAFQLSANPELGASGYFEVNAWYRDLSAIGEPDFLTSIEVLRYGNDGGLLDRDYVYDWKPEGYEVYYANLARIENFEPPYGRTLQERLTNPQMWRDFLMKRGQFAPDPNTIQIGLGSNPITWFMGGGAIRGASFAGKGSTKLLTQGARRFAGDGAAQHFAKHGNNVMSTLGRKSYNLTNYLDDANHVIRNGTFVPELNGYVRLIGGQGSAKYGFVGLNQATGNITTFHIKTAKWLSRNAQSLGIGF